LKGKN
jgi:hypothetical protein